MTNVFTLDAVKADARKKYATVPVILSDDLTVELLPVLKLGQKDREAVQALFKEIDAVPEIDEDDDDIEELVDEYSDKVCAVIAKIFKLICTHPRKLLAALDTEEDSRIRAEVYTTVLKHWMSETQLGEATSSPA